MNKTDFYFEKYYKIKAGTDQQVESLNKIIEHSNRLLSDDALCAESNKSKNQINDELEAAKETLLYVESKLESKLIDAAVEAMCEAVDKDGYNLTIDDIKDVLDCDDRFVADYVLEHVDYIEAPRYSGHYFNNNTLYSCIEQICLIWKKVFISRSSFVQYLLDNAELEYVFFVPNPKNDEKKKFVEVRVSCEISREFINSLLFKQVIFKRRCNLTSLIETDKFYSFLNRICNKFKDLYAYFDSDRLVRELDAIRNLKPSDLHLKVRSKEISDFITKNAHMELTIVCPGTPDRIAYRTDMALDGKMKGKKKETESTLYCFNSILRYEVEDKLEKLMTECNMASDLVF